MIRPPLESMSYPRTGCPPIHFLFRRAADILSRVRSEMISRSNCANDKRMFSVSRPRELVVLNVELLSHRHKADGVPVENLDDSREVEQGPTDPVYLIDDDTVD